jgi:hypothetical protein
LGSLKVFGGGLLLWLSDESSFVEKLNLSDEFSSPVECVWARLLEIPTSIRTMEKNTYQSFQKN